MMASSLLSAIKCRAFSSRCSRSAVEMGVASALRDCSLAMGAGINLVSPPACSAIAVSEETSNPVVANAEVCRKLRRVNGLGVNSGNGGSFQSEALVYRKEGYVCKVVVGEQAFST